MANTNTGAYNAIAFGMAYAEYAVARSIGSTVLYSNRGSDPITLYAMVRREDAHFEDVTATKTQEDRWVFLIAAQPTTVNPIFPPPGSKEGITLSDTITWNGQTYRVEAWDDVGSLNSVFEIRGVARKAKQGGDIR